MIFLFPVLFIDAFLIFPNNNLFTTWLLLKAFEPFFRFFWFSLTGDSDGHTIAVAIAERIGWRCFFSRKELSVRCAFCWWLKIYEVIVSCFPSIHRCLNFLSIVNLLFDLRSWLFSGTLTFADSSSTTKNLGLHGIVETTESSHQGFKVY